MVLWGLRFWRHLLWRIVPSVIWFSVVWCTLTGDHESGQVLQSSSSKCLLSKIFPLQNCACISCLLNPNYIINPAYEECSLLGYKTPVRTSQETHYFSTTESSQLMLCKICGFHGGDYDEYRLLGCYAVWLL
jgi:hypothetical protein